MNLSKLNTKLDLKAERPTPFNISDHLKDDGMIAEYLNVVFEEGKPSEIIMALSHVAQAKGVDFAEFDQNTKPDFEAVLKMIRAIGIDLSVRPAA